MQIDLAGQKAIVTAGGGGIGRVIADTLAKAGAQVVVCDIVPDTILDLPSLESMPSQTRSGISAALVDVADDEALEGFIHKAADAMQGLDILVNNAGISGPTLPAGEISPKQWRAVMEVNVNAQFYAVHAALPYLKKSRNASIVNMSSTAGRVGMPLRVPYSTSKYAVRGFTDVLAVELGEFGIRVNAILPGVVNGERGRRVIAEQAAAKGQSFDEYLPRILHNVSMHTMIEPEEIAAMVAYLSSGFGRHISGQSIGICGNLESYRAPFAAAG